VAFFTPRGRAVFDAPTALRHPGPSPVTGPSRVPKALHPSGATLWKRDSDIPWAIEARAWEALDPG